MDFLLQIAMRKEVMILVAVLLLIVIVLLLVKRSNLKKYRKTLQEYEVRYNAIKSVPLPFKLNKAVAIARVNEEAMQHVTRCKDDFEIAQGNLKAIATSLADTEDFINVGKSKEAKNNLLDLESMIEIGEKQVVQLDEYLSKILERETAQREEVTLLKDQFRVLRQEIQELDHSVSYSQRAIDAKINNIENQFSTFEEWMYASEFDNAAEVLSDIKIKMEDLKKVREELPSLIEKAQGILPRLLEEVKQEHYQVSKKDVYVSHLGFYSNMELIVDSLNEDLDAIKEARVEGIKEHLEDIHVRLYQLLTSIQNEEKAQEELAQSMQTMDELVSKCSESTEYIVGVYPQVQERFNFKYDESAIHRLNAQHFELMVNVADLKKEISSKEKPASELLTTCKELYSALGNCSNEVLEIKKIIDQARSDEERAKKQLLKLQLIMNEIQVKIVKNKLPSISKSYEGDLLKAKEYVLSIENLLKESPLNTKLLNATLDSAIDFIYKLYNNVNNVVGMALMVENTIVFGNKYRSEYSEVDSELTRAELCYRNGEYTQALTIAIAAIEKLFPQTYESMIKENALSAK